MKILLHSTTDSKFSFIVCYRKSRRTQAFRPGVFRLHDECQDIQNDIHSCILTNFMRVMADINAVMKRSHYPNGTM